MLPGNLAVEVFCGLSTVVAGLTCFLVLVIFFGFGICFLFFAGAILFFDRTVLLLYASGNGKGLVKSSKMCGKSRDNLRLIVLGAGAPGSPGWIKITP